jgi:hypothetical protein
MDLAVWEKIRFATTRLLPPIEDYLSAIGALRFISPGRAL